MRPKRGKFPRISEQMKAWSAALGAELATWPQSRSRVFFGFTAFYHGKNIFAPLPRSRALDPVHAIAFKLESARPHLVNRAKRDPRVSFTEMQKKRWFTFAVASDADVRDALGWLSRAYEAAE
jgi:hypothetical protein